MHQVDEHVATADLVALTAIYRQILERYFKVQFDSRRQPDTPHPSCGAMHPEPRAAAAVVAGNIP